MKYPLYILTFVALSIIDTFDMGNGLFLNFDVTTGKISLSRCINHTCLTIYKEPDDEKDTSITNTINKSIPKKSAPNANTSVANTRIKDTRPR